MHTALNNLIGGSLIAGYLLAGLFFFKFWKSSRDTLFVLFAAAFWILAGQRLLLTLSTDKLEDQTHLYVLRLLAYLLILAAILNKNRRSKPSRLRGAGPGDSFAGGASEPGEDDV